MMLKRLSGIGFALLAAISCTVVEGDLQNDVQTYMRSESARLLHCHVRIPGGMLQELLEADRFLQATEEARADTAFSDLRERLFFGDAGSFLLQGSATVFPDGKPLGESGACWTVMPASGSWWDMPALLYGGETQESCTVRCLESGRCWSYTREGYAPVTVRLEEGGYRISVSGSRRTPDGYDCDYRTVEDFHVGKGTPPEILSGVFFHSVSRDGKVLDWCEAVYAPGKEVSYRESR